MESFLLVGKQVLILFIIVFVGYFAGKKHLISDEGSHSMCNLLMFVVSPCMCIVAFHREYSQDDAQHLLLAVLAAVIIHIFGAVLSYIVFGGRKGLEDNRALFQYATMFSNCGFMAFPLQASILGTIGVFYGSSYVVVYNLFCWSWGVYIMSGNRKQLSFKPFMTNPTIVAIILAVVLYFSQLSMPAILYTPIEYISYINTPLPMIVIGYQLSQAKLDVVFKTKYTYICILLRLFVMPMIALGIVSLLQLPYIVSMTLIIASSVPSASYLSLFADRFHRDTALASSTVSLQTALSCITMPIVVGFAQYILTK